MSQENHRTWNAGTTVNMQMCIRMVSSFDSRAYSAVVDSGVRCHADTMVKAVVLEASKHKQTM